MTNPTFHNHNYKVLEASEDWKDTLIEKDNIRATFSIRDFEQNIERMEKTIREVEAKFKHEKLVMDNIEKHHKFIKKMTEQEIYTAWMYREAQEVVKQYEPRLKEFKEAVETERAEMEHVKELLALGKDDGAGAA